MVTPPEDDHLRHVIDTMALYVLDGGCAFEQAIMERGRGNPLFNFLFELGSKEHTYYVWRLYSFAQVHHFCSSMDSICFLGACCLKKIPLVFGIFLALKNQRKGKGYIVMTK